MIFLFKFAANLESEIIKINEFLFIRVSAFLPFYGWFSRYPAISAVDCFSRHGTHTGRESL